MLQKCFDAGLHRVMFLPSVDEKNFELCVLPFVTDCGSSKALRARLHQTLGSLLGGYRLTVDSAQRQAVVCLHLHRHELGPVMRALTAEFPCGHFGRIARLAGNCKDGPIHH